MDLAVGLIFFFGFLIKGATFMDAAILGVVAYGLSMSLLGGIFDKKQ